MEHAQSVLKTLPWAWGRVLRPDSEIPVIVGVDEFRAFTPAPCAQWCPPEPTTTAWFRRVDELPPASRLV